jgi:hypothetical protein
MPDDHVRMWTRSCSQPPQTASALSPTASGGHRPEGPPPPQACPSKGRSSVVEAFARQCAESAWLAGCRFGVVTSTFPQAGRGRSLAVLARLDQIAAEVVRELADGTIEVQEARARITEAGFDGAIHIAASAGELGAVIAAVMRAGDNVWTDCSPDGLGIAYLRWWSDPNHPRF